MTEHLFEVKGEFYEGQRVYMVHHSRFYDSLRANLVLLRDFLRRMGLALQLFARLGIVHADLKPENIMLKYDTETETIQSLKIIDLGSSFLLNNRGTVIENQIEFNASTPEYLPPEIHAFLTNKQHKNGAVKIQDYASTPYVFDMWALGSILLEILSGFPLWLSLKSRMITDKNRSVMGHGLFGVSGRDSIKILEKQN